LAGGEQGGCGVKSDRFTTVSEWFLFAGITILLVLAFLSNWMVGLFFLAMLCLLISYCAKECANDVRREEARNKSKDTTP
jgi:hypothetical protein